MNFFVLALQEMFVKEWLITIQRFNQNGASYDISNGVHANGQKMVFLLRYYEAIKCDFHRWI